MWKATVVAEANPLIVLVVARVCLISRIAESFAGTTVVVAKGTSSRRRVYVALVPAELTTTIVLTIAVVEDGTVYRVVEEVAAAPL
jgi:hypothetical protein